MQVKTSLCLLLFDLASSLHIPRINTMKGKSTMITKTVFGAERKLDLPEEFFPSADQMKSLEEPCGGSSCQHGWFTSSHNGAQLHYRKWMPSNASKPKAIVVHTHGIQTHSGNALVLKNGRKVGAALRKEAFNKAGYAVYAHDMYGHGFSEGQRWLVPDWKTNLADCKEFVRRVETEHPDVPIFLMGESYGSCLTIHLAREYQDKPEEAPKNFDSIILCASAIDADLPPLPVRFVLKNIFAALWPEWTPSFMPNPISADRIWRDEEVLAHKTDPKRAQMQLDTAGTPFRLGTGANLLDALIDVKKRSIPGLTMPFCLLHGTEDAGCPVSGAKFMFETASTSDEDKQLSLLEGAYHDLFSDPLAEEAMKRSLDWIEMRLKKKSS